MSDDELRALWLRAGGTFHGPFVEFGEMGVTLLWPFLRELLAKAILEAVMSKSKLVPLSELEWIARQYDDSVTTATLADRLYDVCCTVRGILAVPNKDGEEIAALKSQPSDYAELIERLDLAAIASCSCSIKTPEIKYHNEHCVYRVLHDAAAAIGALERRVAEQAVKVSSDHAEAMAKTHKERPEHK